MKERETYKNNNSEKKICKLCESSPDACVHTHDPIFLPFSFRSPLRINHNYVLSHSFNSICLISAIIRLGCSAPICSHQNLPQIQMITERDAYFFFMPLLFCFYSFFSFSLSRSISFVYIPFHGTFALRPLPIFSCVFLCEFVGITQNITRVPWYTCGNEFLHSPFYLFVIFRVFSLSLVFVLLLLFQVEFCYV